VRAGDIVLIEKPQAPSGRTTYPHFFIKVHVPDSLKAGDHISCLGITSRTPTEAFDPEQHVQMRWLGRKGGDPSTGLSKPSIAKVTFQHTLIVKRGAANRLEVDAEHRGKYVRADHFQTLTAVLNSYNRKLLLERQMKNRAPDADSQ
jgi:hypothetical protein